MHEIQEIEARLAAATPGQWDVETIPETGESRVFVRSNTGDPMLDVSVAPHGVRAEDAEFIAYAPEDIRALIEEVGRLTVEHLEMRIERDNLRDRRDYYRKAVMKADGEIEAVRELHRKMPLYDTPADECAEHDQDVYGIELDSGEWYCSEHIAEWVCSECFNDGGEYVDYPCETARALGVTE